MFRVLDVGPSGTATVTEGKELVGPPPEGILRWIDLQKQDDALLGLLRSSSSKSPANPRCARSMAMLALC